MNINKAFRSGNLNKWLFDLINEKNKIKEKVSLNFTTIVVMQIVTIFHLYVYINRGGCLKEVFVLGISSCFLSICFIIKWKYVKTFTRHYEIFFEEMINLLDSDMSFESFINEIQCNIDTMKKGKISDILVKLATPMVSLERSDPNSFKQMKGWDTARTDFCKAFCILSKYGLTHSGEWTLYTNKALTTLIESENEDD